LHEGWRGGQKLGHTLREHVGMSIDDLHQRLIKQPKLNKASSFWDEINAEQVITEAFRHPSNRKKIRDWRNGKGETLVLYYDTGSSFIGHIMPRGQNGSTFSTKVRILLVRLGKGKNFFIRKAHPD
jgi:hypothetical protein